MNRQCTDAVALQLFPMAVVALPDIVGAFFKIVGKLLHCHHADPGQQHECLDLLQDIDAIQERFTLLPRHIDSFHYNKPSLSHTNRMYVLIACQKK